MSGAIGHTYVYNIIILFIVVVFAFLAGTLSYYKAFKVNNTIVGSVEKFEGYNSKSKEEIEHSLGNIGYRVKGNSKCAESYKNMTLVTLNENYEYCIYVDNTKPKAGEYYTYGVVTRMRIDLPIVSTISIPIFTRTNRIYKFTNT